MKYSTTALFEDAEDHLNASSDAGGVIMQMSHGTTRPTLKT
jgi:hypothetical protein